MHEKQLILTHTPQAPLERLEPRVKFVCLLMWVIVVVSLPAGAFAQWGAYALVVAILVAWNHRLAGKFLRRLAPALPLVLGVCLVVPFLRSGEPLWEWGPLSVSRAGVEQTARVGSAALLCVAGVALVWAGTSQEALLVGLRGVGVPGMFVGVLAFMLRYLEVLRPELHRLTDARAARTIGARGPGRLRSGANVLGALFLRAHDRAERVGDAMAARGYAGRLRPYDHSHLRATDVAVGLAFAALLLALRLALRS